jgi:Zn-dependent peptidase ImmA (M78 family)/DNA-binding XRE family transcriptional regulator
MFSPVRFSLARKRRQLTKKELALRAGVSQLTLTRLESGETVTPADDTVASLAAVLQFPVTFFYLGDCDELQVKSVSFRSPSSLTARQRDAALAAGPIAFSIDDWVTERYNLPEPDLLDLRDEDPVAAADALRSHWGIGSKPVPHMTKLLEAKGVRVFALSEQHKNVDAYSCWRDVTPYIFLNTFKSAERSRFDAAHELGHLVLHRHGDASGRNLEREADQFASAFLIPRADLIGNLPKWPSLRILVAAKERWGVSVGALARTAFDAGLLSDWNYRDICKQISVAGYRSKEPNSRPREESVLWRKVFETLWKERMTKDHLARELSIPPDEIESLVGGLAGDRPHIDATSDKAHRSLRAV